MSETEEKQEATIDPIFSVWSCVYSNKKCVCVTLTSTSRLSIFFSQFQNYAMVVTDEMPSEGLNSNSTLLFF